jgi:hypothetical protein
MCPEVDSASNNEYQGDDLGNLYSAECRDDPGALTSWNPKSHSRLVEENLCLLSSSVGTMVLFRVLNLSDHDTDHLRMTSVKRTSGAIPLFPLCAYMAHRVTTSHN